MKKGLIVTLLASILVVGAAPISASAEWKQNVNNQWCWINNLNMKATGWTNINGLWYFFDTNGIMKTGWIQSGDKWYYSNESGVMQHGWIKQENSWYHFGDTTGAMDTDTVVEGYYLGEDGVMQDIAKNKVLFEDEYAKVTYIGINKDSKLGPKIKVQIQNKSNKALCVQTKDDVSVDNTKKNAKFSEEIQPNSTIIANIILPSGTDKKFKIVSGDFKVIEKSSWNTLATEEFSMNF